MITLNRNNGREVSRESRTIAKLRGGRARAGRARPMLACMLLALFAGCTFSWDDSGIKDVNVIGRRPGDIGPQDGKEGKEGTTASAEGAAPAVATPAPAGSVAAGAPVSEDSSLRRIAILPVAYRDQTGGQSCDLCAGAPEMKPTNAMSARLATGFLYEAIARHPRLLFPPPGVVDQTLRATPGQSYRAAATSLSAGGKADYVVAAALLDLRPRVGPDNGPDQPAGVAMYAALVDARSGEVLWSDTFDDDESGRNLMLRAYDRVMNDKPIRWRSADEYCEHAVDELVEDLVDEVD